MATYAKINLSPGGTEGDGNPIPITDTAGNGSFIHDTGTSSGIRDEVWLWMTNIDTTSILVTLHIGYVSSASAANAEKVMFKVPPQTGLMLVLSGHSVRGTGSAARRIAAIADTANKINVVGYVNRITD
tara:strand:- start:2972 stop:3358 length:387 start_codon:yes stop_codon:yes gene_type:complete